MKRDIAILIEQSANTIDNLNGGLRFTREEQLFVCDHFEPVEILKNELLTRLGKVEKYLYFVEEGRLRYWVPDGDEREKTIRFAFDGNFACAYHSLRTGQPAAYNIEALTPTRLWRITGKDLTGFYSWSLTMNKVMRIFLEESCAQTDNRIDYLLDLSPRYRYESLLKKEKGVILLVALKHIASYLGITPQTLSRIRKG